MKQSLRLSIMIWRQVYDAEGNLDIVVEPQDLGDLFHDSCVMCPNACGLEWIQGYLFVRVTSCRDDHLVEIGFDPQECMYRYPHLMPDENANDLKPLQLESCGYLDTIIQ